MAEIIIDNETQGFAPKNFILGAVTKETGVTKTFRNKKQMWNYIIELGEKEAKRGHNTFVRAHNLKYDLYGIWDYKDKKMKNKASKILWYEREINTIKKNGKKTKRKLIFLDTGNLFAGSLEKIGELLGHQKTKMPEKLKKKAPQNYTEQELKEIEEYCANDTKVLMKFMLALKKELKEQNINIKMLMGAGQIGMSYFKNLVLTKTYAHKILNPRYHEDEEGRKYLVGHYIFMTNKGSQFVQKANRGARVEAFKLGEIKNCYDYDMNSFYPSIAEDLRFPDLRSEKIIKEPLKTMSLDELLEKSGVSKVLIRKKKEEIGQIPVRWNPEKESTTIPEEDEDLKPNYGIIFPKQDCYIIGSYVHEELKEFKANGHKILAIEKSVIYEDLKENPLKEMMRHFYAQRKKGEFQKAFYKNVMNHMIGKFSQMNEKRETIDAKPDWLEDPKYGEQRKKEGWRKSMEVSNTLDRFAKTIKKTPAWCYNPIISAKIYAIGRNKLFKTLKKIGQDLVYCDTDGFTATGNQKQHLQISQELGQWRKQKQNVTALIKGKKALMLGNEVYLSGAGKIFATPEAFKKGTVKIGRIITEKTTAKREECGEVEWLDINVEAIKKREETRQKKATEENLFIDITEYGELDYLKEKLEKELSK